MNVAPALATAAAQQNTPAHTIDRPATGRPGVRIRPRARSAEPRIPHPTPVSQQRAADTTALSARQLAVYSAPYTAPSRDRTRLPARIAKTLQEAFASKDPDRITHSLEKAVADHGAAALAPCRIDCSALADKNLPFKEASVFFLACHSARIESIALLTPGATDCLEETPESTDGIHGRTPLLIAIQQGKGDVVAHLLTLGANTDACDSQARCPDLYNVLFNARRPAEYRALEALLRQHGKGKKGLSPSLQEKIYCQQENGKDVLHTLYLRGDAIPLDSPTAITCAERVLQIMELPKERARKQAQEKGEEPRSFTLCQGVANLLEQLVLTLRYAASNPAATQLLSRYLEVAPEGDVLDMLTAVQTRAREQKKHQEIQVRQHRAAWREAAYQLSDATKALERAQFVLQQAEKDKQDKEVQLKSALAEENAAARTFRKAQAQEQAIKDAVHEADMAEVDLFLSGKVTFLGASALGSV